LSWTNKLDEDEIMAEWTSPSEHRNTALSISADLLQAEEDTEERKLRDGDSRAISGERYEQRTRVFEALLEFITDGDKQPSEDLLDIIDVDEAL
jgi:hypothetical protein